MNTGDEVMWFSGNYNVRDGRLIGVTKVHRLGTDGRSTMCGRSITARPRRMVEPTTDDPRCTVCAGAGS